MVLHTSARFVFGHEVIVFMSFSSFISFDFETYVMSLAILASGLISVESRFTTQTHMTD